jgi:hypothetical protein
MKYNEFNKDYYILLMNVWFTILRLLDNTLPKPTIWQQEREFSRPFLRQRVAISKEVGRIVLVLQLGQTRQLVCTKHVLNGLVTSSIVDENGRGIVSSVRAIIRANLGTVGVCCVLRGVVSLFVDKLSLAITHFVSKKCSIEERSK